MDRKEFILMVERNQRAVRRFLVALCCGDISRAEDLAQDTFVKAYLACGSFREDAKFSTWIYRIAYNTYVSSQRSQRQTEQIEIADTMISAEKSDSAFRYQALYNALGRLSEKERSAILLYYMQGYDINEIAEITQSSSDAVKKLLSRGRKHIKQLIEK